MMRHRCDPDDVLRAGRCGEEKQKPDRSAIINVHAYPHCPRGSAWPSREGGVFMEVERPHLAYLDLFVAFFHYPASPGCPTLRTYD